MQLSPTDKKSARTYFLALRKSISKQHGSDFSRLICESLYKEILRCSPKTVLLYYPVRGEVDVLPLAKLLWGSGISVAFPISHTADTRLSFHTVTSLNDMEIGTYGICEPSAKCPEITDFSDCTCIVPALSVDKHGIRLGYGGGYYDRFLSDKHIKRICPIYSELVCDRLPCDNTDIKISIICTEKGEIFVEQ